MNPQDQDNQPQAIGAQPGPSQPSQQSGAMSEVPEQTVPVSGTDLGASPAPMPPASNQSTTPQQPAAAPLQSEGATPPTSHQNKSALPIALIVVGVLLILATLGLVFL
jgi:hypothetical protein